MTPFHEYESHTRAARRRRVPFSPTRVALTAAVYASGQTSARSTAYRDTLVVRGDTLVRTLTLTTGPFEERYVWVR